MVWYEAYQPLVRKLPLLGIRTANGWYLYFPPQRRDSARPMPVYGNHFVGDTAFFSSVCLLNNDKNVPFAQESKVPKRKDSDMKRSWVLGIWALLALPCSAQQIMYSNLKELVEDRGDTVTILKVEKRSKNQIYLMGGADYRIEAEDNSGLCRYLKSRCYAVRIDTSLYVNCRKMRYKRYRFGGWYAPAMWVKGKIYYCAQPVGQVAASTATPPDATKLGGEVGDAINASGLVFARVYYELNPETGRSEFVGRKKMLELLAGYPELKEAFEKETSESSEVIGKYLRQLESEPTCSTE